MAASRDEEYAALEREATAEGGLASHLGLWFAAAASNGRRDAEAATTGDDAAAKSEAAAGAAKKLRDLAVDGEAGGEDHSAASSTLRSLADVAEGTLLSRLVAKAARDARAAEVAATRFRGGVPRSDESHETRWSMSALLASGFSSTPQPSVGDTMRALVESPETDAYAAAAVDVERVPSSLPRQT